MIDPNIHSGRFRKTALVNAARYRRGLEDGFDQAPEFPIVDDVMWNEAHENGYVMPYLDTLEGKMRIAPGSWICTGVKGERWAIAGDIFEQSYEYVEPLEPSS